MQRTTRSIALVAVVLASLLPLALVPAIASAQACTEVGQGAPDEGMAQRFREAYDATSVDLGKPVDGLYGCVHRWDGYGPWTQTFKGPEGETNLMYQELHDAVYRLYGDWLAKYTDRGGPDVFGAPIDNPHQAGPPSSTEQYFEGDAAGRTGFFRRFEGAPVYVVQGEILKRYVDEGGTFGRLGAPLSDEFDWDGGKRANFDNGHILYDASGGDTDVVIVEDLQPSPTGSQRCYATYCMNSGEYHFCIGAGNPSHWPICAWTIYTAQTALDAAEQNFPGTLTNGTGDAFRHCLWSGLMTFQMGSEWATTMGNLHEDEPDPDPEVALAVRNMDLHNNAVGRTLAEDLAGGADPEVRLAEACAEGTSDGTLIVLVRVG